MASWDSYTQKATPEDYEFFEKYLIKEENRKEQ